MKSGTPSTFPLIKRHLENQETSHHAHLSILIALAVLLQAFSNSFHPHHHVFKPSGPLHRGASWWEPDIHAWSSQPGRPYFSHFPEIGDMRRIDDKNCELFREVCRTLVLLHSHYISCNSPITGQTPDAPISYQELQLTGILSRGCDLIMD